jgi:putative transposase
MIGEIGLSERRACALVGLSRDAYRHRPVLDEQTRQLKAKIIDVAHTRRRFGYRRVHDMVKPVFPGVNHKKIYRLYTEAGLTVRKRKKAKRPIGERQPLKIARAVNDVWSMDFVSDNLVNGRRLKCLTVADDFSHESVDIAVDFGIGGAYVVRILDQAATFKGYPSAVRTDNGPEFTSRVFMGWCQANGVKHLLIEPGKPTQNGYIESFNGKFRDECLNEHWFDNLAQARTAIAAWRIDYNEVRPHSSCGRMPPAKYAALHRATPKDAITKTEGFS